MVKKIQVSTRLDLEVVDKMELIKERDGVPYAVQITRGMLLYFKEKGLVDEPEEVTRPRPKKVARG